MKDYKEILKGRQFVVTFEGEAPNVCEGERFARANENGGLAPEDFAEVEALAVGQSAHFGGGAAPLVEVRREL